ncbi:MAG: carbohydrate binding domain-containing protein [Lentisphaeria bacterium]|nr:carbohydrate binding domain-containing protein [Lentisphaeria bacterium]
MKSEFLSALLLSLPLCLGAQNVFSDGFESKLANWQAEVGRHTAPGQGRNNSSALLCQRIKGQEKQSRTFRRSIPGLQPGKKYTFSAYIRLDAELKAEDVRFGVETRSNPGAKAVSFAGAVSKAKDGKWLIYKGEFTTQKPASGITGYDYDLIVSIRNKKYGKFLIDDITVDQYDETAKYKDPKDPENVVLNGGFEHGGVWWRYVGKTVLVPGGGVNNSTALKVHRTPDYSGNNFRNRMYLEPCTKYVYGGSIRLGKDTKIDQIRFGVEARSIPDYKWGGYTFASKKSQNGQWMEFSGEITTYANNGGGTSYAYEFIIFLKNGTYGTYYVDNIWLKKSGSADLPKIPTAINYPAGGQLTTDGGKVTLTSSSGTVNGNGIWKITDEKGKIVKEGKTSFVNYSVTIDTGKLKAGTYRIAIASEAEQNDYSLRNSLQLVVNEPAVQKGDSVCVMDEYGRTLFNGKPYMPLGFFIYGMPDKHLELFKGTPFNTLMSYATWQDTMDLDHIMDTLLKQDMKLILSLKDFYDLPKDGGMLAVKKYKNITGCENIVRYMINRYRNHPALLAYYICDERPVSDWKIFLDRKDMINRLDPNHPTYSVHCTPGAFPTYSCWQDIFGCDPYPIENAATNHMKPVTDHVTASRKVAIYPKGVGYWMVPQYFNHASYQVGIPQSEAFKRFRWPTETETIAACVMGAIHGARGFLFFNFSDMFRAADPVKFEVKWNAIVNVGNTLKKLEPWIMSVTPPEMIPVTDVKGKIFAARFVDDQGKLCIMIAAEGPGDARAVFKAPAGMKSMYGRTVYSNGSYRFSGKDITCDILIEE